MDHKGYSIVLQGEFDPKKFEPILLANNGIEDRNSLDSTELHNFSNELVQFEMNKTYYTIERNKFQITSENIDLANLLNNKLTLLFCDLFPNIPVNIFSIVKFLHIKLNSHDEWVNFYTNLTPQDKMSKFANDMEKSNEKFQNGLYRLQLCASEEIESFNLMKFITIERSQFFSDSIGVYVSEEFQYFVETSVAVKLFVDVLRKEIDKRIREAEDTFQTVRGLR